MFSHFKTVFFLNNNLLPKVPIVCVICNYRSHVEVNRTIRIAGFPCGKSANVLPGNE